MAKFTKEEREQAKQRLRDACRECAPDGTATLLIVCTDGADHFDVEILDVWNGRPALSARINHSMHVALGYRMTADRLVMVPGCGKNKARHVASELASLCGHPVRVEGSYRGVVG